MGGAGFLSISVFSFSMLAMKKLVQYVDVILHIVSKTSIFDSQYLEIFGFIPIDFMCFLIKCGIHSAFTKEMRVFFITDYS